MDSFLRIALVRAPSMGRHRPAHGFTLFELMVVVGIAAILAALAVPAMRGFLQTQEDISAATNLMTSINYARSEAIKADIPAVGANGVRICASADGLTCDAAGNWNNGWIVLSSANPTPLESTGAVQTGLTVTAGPATPAIVFQPDGTTTLPALVEFRICDSRGGTFAHEVEIDLTGRVQAASQAGFDVTGAAALVCP